MQSQLSLIPLPGPPGEAWPSSQPARSSQSPALLGQVWVPWAEPGREPRLRLESRAHPHPPRGSAITGLCQEPFQTQGGDRGGEENGGRQPAVLFQPLPTPHSPLTP